MLMHEWIKYRDAQIKRAAKPGTGAAGDGAEAQETTSPPEQAAAQTEPAAPASAEVAGQPTSPDTADATPVAAEDAQETRADAESTNREKEALLRQLHNELLASGRNLQGRLQALQGRQKQLPMDVDGAAQAGERGRPKGASETREDLVRRLLDPTLTLRETALLLDVCPATVRRYTDRGVLSCYRTAGNQRRFRLSDVLDFIERRERERS